MSIETCCLPGTRHRLLGEYRLLSWDAKFHFCSENQKLEIEALLAQRQSLFSTCTNITLPIQGAVVNVSDVVDEHKKLEAEAVQENLKGLLKDCTITVMPWL
jgi:hypothetical protein